IYKDWWKSLEIIKKTNIEDYVCVLCNDLLDIIETFKVSREGLEIRNKYTATGKNDIRKSNHVLKKEEMTIKKNIDENNTSDIPDILDTSEEIDDSDYQSSNTIYNDSRDISLSLISIIEEYYKKDSISKF
ncbi:12146_t:CDS:2, partial [Funneliformis geosporum]